MEKFDIIFYIFIIIFSITAIITFLGITNIIKTIRTRYLNALFAALVLEVVAAVIFTYKQIDFSCKEDERIAYLCEDVLEINPNDDNEKKVRFLKTLIDSQKSAVSQVEIINRELQQCRGDLERAGTDLDRLDRVFYSNVIKLRLVADTIRGNTINLIWEQDKKQVVYDLLWEIFKELGYLSPNDRKSVDYIINKYIDFTRQNGIQDKRLFTNDAGQFTQILIDEYATTIFLRKYLNLKYPLLP